MMKKVDNNYKLRIIIKTFLLCNQGATCKELANFINKNKLIGANGVSTREISHLLRNSRNTILRDVQVKTVDNTKVYYLS